MFKTHQLFCSPSWIISYGPQIGFCIGIDVHSAWVTITLHLPFIFISYDHYKRNYVKN